MRTYGLARSFFGVARPNADTPLTSARALTRTGCNWVLPVFRQLSRKVIGESKIKVHRSQGQEYVFSNVVEGASDQRWKAVITPSFIPISAELTFEAAASSTGI